jgi:hypothetical protein
MRLQTRYFITRLAATLVWIAVCVVALILWIGISTHARAQSLPSQQSRNITQNSRGPAAFPVEPRERSVAAPAPSATCGDYKRQIDQLQTVIQLQNQKIAMISKK